MTLPRVAGGATASYTGENKDAKTSETRFDDVKLTAKTLIAMVPISNALIGRAGFNVEQLVLQDILTAISVREDKAFMRDDGTGDTPIGMKARATQWNRLLPWEADAAINLNTVDEYLDKIILMAMDGNSNMISSGWGMSNRTYMKLFGLRDGNGNKVYPEMAQGLLKGYPVQRTSAIPANLGTGGKETEIYFADFNDVVIAEDGNMKVDFSKEASYIDADGTLVSAFSRGHSVSGQRCVSEWPYRTVAGNRCGEASSFPPAGAYAMSLKPGDMNCRIAISYVQSGRGPMGEPLPEKQVESGKAWAKRELVSGRKVRTLDQLQVVETCLFTVYPGVLVDIDWKITTKNLVYTVRNIDRKKDRIIITGEADGRHDRAGD